MLEKAHEKMRRLRRLIFQHGHGRPQKHTFQSLKPLSRCAIVLYFYCPDLPGSCNMQTAAHITSERPKTNVGSPGGSSTCGTCPGVQTCGITAGGGVDLGASKPIVPPRLVAVHKQTHWWIFCHVLSSLCTKIHHCWRPESSEKHFFLLFLCNCFPGESFNRIVLPNKTPVF